MPFQLYEQSNAWKELLTKNADRNLKFPQHGRAIRCIEVDNLTKGFSFYGQLAEYTKVPGKNVYKTRIPISLFDVLEGIYFSSPVLLAWLELSPHWMESREQQQTLDLDTKNIFIDANGDGKDLAEPLPVVPLTHTYVDLFISARPAGTNSYSLPTPTYRAACVRSDFRQKLAESKQTWMGYSVWNGLVQNQ